jgi:hypothetical protein
MARQWVIIDVPLLPPIGAEDSLIRLSYPQDLSHHAFVFTEKAMTGLVQRLGIPQNDCRAYRYNGNKNITYVIDTTRMARGLVGA